MRDIGSRITPDKFSLSIYQNSDSSHRFSENIYCDVETLIVSLALLGVLRLALTFRMVLDARKKWACFFAGL